MERGFPESPLACEDRCQLQLIPTRDPHLCRALAWARQSHRGFAYVIRGIPPERFPFRRWRWELWQDALLVAAGWVTTPHRVERALRVAASRRMHQLAGVNDTGLSVCLKKLSRESKVSGLSMALELSDKSLTS